jgi:serine/threonine-protein kinase
LLTPGFNSDRMLLEARVVNQVGHPNIVDIFETGKLADGRAYIVMERLSGQALSVRAYQCKLTPDLVIAILLQICDALIAAHAAGIVHRDLKLDNVFLVDNPEDPAIPKVKLLDWGIAKVISDDAKYTTEGALIGTPQYLAPEQARGQTVSPKTDVYSLGAMAYELFLEQPPFEAETAAEVIAMHLRTPPPPPSELWPDIPPVLHHLLLAMLAKQPSLRPTVREVIRQLETVRDELERRRQPPSSSPYPTATAVEATAVEAAAVEATAEDPADLTTVTPIRSSAWWTRARPWQYTIGVLALVASARIFLVHRGDGQAASAATKVDAGEAREADHKTAPPAPNPPAHGAPAREQPIVSDLEKRPTPAIKSAAAVTPLPPRPTPAPANPTPTSGPSSPASATPAAPTRPAGHTSPPHSPPPRATPAPRSSVAPHRGIKLDPDGTLDPYR